MRRFILFSLFVSFWFSSCYEDKGKYNLIDYNDITLDTEASFTRTKIALGDTVRIVPKVTWKYPDRDTLAYDYRWEMGLGNVISTDRNLEFIPTSCGQFDVNFYMTDRQTGLEFHASYENITVESPYKAGWLILSEKDKRTSLSYVRRDSKQDGVEESPSQYVWKIFPDIYASLHPDDLLGEKPLKVKNVMTGNSGDEVMVLQGSGDSYYLSGEDFTKVMKLRDEFPESNYPAGLFPVDYRNGGFQDFVLSADGNVYWKRNTGGLIQHVSTFIEIPLYFSGVTKNARITKFLDPDAYFCDAVFMYDEENSRVVGRNTSFMYADDSTPLEFFYSGGLDVVKLTNLTGYEMMYMGYNGGGTGFDVILKDKSKGTYRYQKIIGYNYSGVRISQCDEVDLKDVDLSDNTVYHRLRMKSYIFMGEKNKLYFYDINTKIVKLFADYASGNIVEILSGPGSEEIGVALDNGNFYIYELSPKVLADDNPGKIGLLFHVSDLGRIVDIEWKWGGFTNRRYDRY